MHEQDHSSKTKGEQIREIQAFENFYKIKWNLKFPRYIVRHVEEVVAKLKQAHKDKCVLYLWNFLINNPSSRLEPSKPPFPQPVSIPCDRFGLADEFLGKLTKAGNFLVLDIMGSNINLSTTKIMGVTFTHQFISSIKQYRQVIWTTTEWPQALALKESVEYKRQAEEEEEEDISPKKNKKGKKVQRQPPAIPKALNPNTSANVSSSKPALNKKRKQTDCSLTSGTFTKPKRKKIPLSLLGVKAKTYRVRTNNHV